MSKGHINISRRKSNTEDDYMHISIQDEDSRITFLEVKMTLEDFMRALTNLGNVPCSFEVRDLDLIGKTREVKHEFIPLKDYFKLTDGDIKELLKPYEVDGWVGSEYDIKNHHNYDYSKKVLKVGFSRFVG